MGYAEASLTLEAPIEAVWNSLNDIDHTPDWVVGLENAEVTTPGFYGVGTVYVDYNRLGPVLQVTSWRITEFEPMTHQVHVSASQSLPSTMTISLSALPEGTQVRMSVEFQFLPGLGLIGRWLERGLMNRVLPSVLRQNLRNLDAYLKTHLTTVAAHAA